MTDVKKGRIPLLRNTVGETALAKSFCSNNKRGEYKVSMCLQKNKAAWKGCTP